MQPNPYAYNPYGYNPYQTGVQMPVRYAIPPGYRQPSPPYANQSFDRYPSMPAAVRPAQNMTQPIRYPPGYRPGYPPSGMPMAPAGTHPRQQQNPSEQLQPPEPYYYNPYGSNEQPPKKGAKEYKESAFTIAPEGAHAESIKGLVSNNDINDLLKHKGTKVKVSKIYRITKTKPQIIVDSSSDDDIPLRAQQPSLRPQQSPLRTQQSPPRAQQSPIRAQQSPLRTQQPPPPSQPSSQPVRRPSSSSSSDSHCSTCSNCSCSDCHSRRRSHVYDDCPECRAEFKREQARRQRRK